MNSEERFEELMKRIEDMEKKTEKGRSDSMSKPWEGKYGIDGGTCAKVGYWCCEYVHNHPFREEAASDGIFIPNAMPKERMELAVKSIAELLGLGEEEVERYLNDVVYRKIRSLDGIEDYFDADRIVWEIRESKQYYRDLMEGGFGAIAQFRKFLKEEKERNLVGFVSLFLAFYRAWEMVNAGDDADDDTERTNI